ncbi:MAG: PPC domain-containing protein [Bryobacteraceae bacterium]|nr:PPC domain-containing protein [Bryobacteraceae bacterium]MDW8379954.1 PPC domain-containing protein [Bryobacterales bacterium]
MPFRAAATLLFCFVLLRVAALGQVEPAAVARPMRALRHSDPETARRLRELRLSIPSRAMRLRPAAEYRLSVLADREIAAARQGLAEGLAFAGLHRDLPEQVFQMARVDVLDSGRQVWRVSIRSPGAAGLRVHFTRFDVGPGRVWVHDGSGDEAEIHGPYTGRGIFGDGDFWSDIVLNENLVIEYEPASALGPIDHPPFEVRTISHLTPDGLPLFADSKTPVRATAASCHLDVSCHPEWEETAKAVAQILFESNGRTATCSGTLLNTRNESRIPYFLTARHCIANDATARTVNAFWHYRAARCNGAPPDRRNVPRTLGARYLAGTAVNAGDAALIQLTSLPDGVNFSGWDPSPLPPGLSVTGIHHPAGDYQRISFGTSRLPVPFSGKDLETFVGAFWGGGGLTEGGSSGSGLFRENLILVGILSHGPKADTALEYCAKSPFADNYGRFSSFYPVIREFLEGRATTTPPAANLPAGGPLISGQPRSITIPAVTSARLLNGPNGFTINVPAGATRLEITLRTSTPNVDVDLYARFGQDVTLEGGRAVADFRSEGPAGDEQIVITGNNLRVGAWFIALGVFTPGVEIRTTLTATVTAGSSLPPTTGQALTSGVPRTVNFPPVQNPTLFNGSSGLTITVPQGATRLEVTMRAITLNADVDLYVRRDQDVGLEGGRVVADFRSEREGDSNESIVITPPQLQPGTYFIAFGVYTRNTPIQVSVTATVLGGTPPPAGTQNPLVSSEPRSFTLPPFARPTLVAGTNSFTIIVPPNATRLEVTLRSTTPEADVDLYVRRGQNVVLENGRVVADFRSERDGDSNESVVVTPPQLQPDVYYIAFGVFTPNKSIQLTVTATVTTATGPTVPANVLISGQPRSFTLGPVSSPTLFRGTNGFTINVPENATSLQITLRTTPASADVDLYARAGQDIGLEGGRVVADARSERPDGTEDITISGPALRPGTYFIGFGLFTPRGDRPSHCDRNNHNDSCAPASGHGTGHAHQWRSHAVPADCGERANAFCGQSRIPSASSAGSEPAGDSPIRLDGFRAGGP